MQCNVDHGDGKDCQELALISARYVWNFFIVPPKLREGDYFTPLLFKRDSKNFCILGRYNAEKDAVEFCLAVSAKSAYKMYISDISYPYRWQVKRHGVTKTSPTGLEQFRESYMEGVRSRRGMNILHKMEENERQKLREESFKSEDILAVPHAIMRSSSRETILDSKVGCKYKDMRWSFYGPSQPEYFCCCRVMIVLYGDDNDHAEKIKAAEEGEDRAFTEQDIREEQDDQAIPTEQPQEDLNPQNNPKKYGGDSDENTD